LTKDKTSGAPSIRAFGEWVGDNEPNNSNTEGRS